MANTPKMIGGADPSVLRSLEAQTPSVARTSPATVSATTGSATSAGTTVTRGIAPVVTNDVTTYNQATQTVAGTSLTITSSANNSSADVVTVYTSPDAISVSSVNQTVNTYKVTNGGNYGDANVAAYLPTYTGNLSPTNLVVSTSANLGAVGNITITGGTAGQILSTNGNGVLSWSSDATTYGNSNVANYLPTFTGNVGANVVKTNAIYFTGNTIAEDDIEGTGNFGFETPANVGFGILTDAGNNEWSFGSNGTLSVPGINSAAIEGADGFNLRFRAIGEDASAKLEYYNGSSTTSVVAVSVNSVSIDSNGNTWTFDQNGNLTLPGNTFAVNYANGTQVNISGGANTGNVTFDNQIVIGTGDSGGFGGLYLAPGDTEQLANSGYFRVRGGDVPTHLHFDTGNNAYFDQYFGDDNKYVKLEAGTSGNIVIGTDGNGQKWTFGDSGELTVPGDIQAITTGFSFNADINGINTSTANIVIVTLTSSPFPAPVSGQVTITDVVGTTETNGTWYFQAVEADQFQLYYDAELNNPVDGTGWTAYESGGVAVALGYNDLGIIGGNVSITTNNNDSWTFTNNGGTIFPTLTVDLHNGGNQSAQTLQFGDTDQQAIITGPTPATDNNAQRLIIQGQRASGTGEGGDVYLWAGDSDLYGGDIKIYAGDADNTSAGSGGYINITGGAGFDNGGSVNITAGQSGNGQGATASVTGGQGQVGGGEVYIQGGYAQTGSGGPVGIYGGGANDGYTSWGNVTIGTAQSEWVFDNTGNLTLPTISLGSGVDEQAIIGSQRKLIPPLRYSAVIDADNPTIVYTATNVDTNSMKVAIQIQHAGLGFEFFEVFATYTGSDTYYTVGNRVSPPTIDASTVVVGLTGTPAMKITVTINSGAATSWVTYDAVEFGIAVD